VSQTGKFVDGIFSSCSRGATAPQANALSGTTAILWAASPWYGMSVGSDPGVHLKAAISIVTIPTDSSPRPTRASQFALNSELTGELARRLLSERDRKLTLALA
jgi:hypothetical protein